MPRKKKVSNNYWTDKQERLVASFITEADQAKRSLIYVELRPSILTMIESILRRYFYSFLRLSENQEELVYDCEIFLHDHLVFHKFNKERAKAYAFLGTTIKNYFIDAFKTRSKESDLITSIYRKVNDSDKDSPSNNENGLIIDVPEEIILLSERDEEYNELVIRSKKYVDDLLKTTRADSQTIKIFEGVRLLLNETNYGKYYASYFLMRVTKISSHNIYAILVKYNLGSLIYASNRLNLNYYERKIIEYKKQHGSYKGWIKDALNNLENEKTEFRIESKSERRAKREAEKATKIKNLVS